MIFFNGLKSHNLKSTQWFIMQTFYSTEPSSPLVCSSEAINITHFFCTPNTASLTVSLSLSLFLPFSLFSHPSFFTTLLFPSFLSLYPLLFPNLFCFFLPIFFSASPFLTSFLYLDVFPDSFLLRSSPFHSLALSLSLHLSLLFFLFHFFFVLFLFLLGWGPPPRGFSAMSRLCILCIL